MSDVVSLKPHYWPWLDLDRYCMACGRTRLKPRRAANGPTLEGCCEQCGRFLENVPATLQNLRVLEAQRLADERGPVRLKVPMVRELARRPKGIGKLPPGANIWQAIWGDRYVEQRA
jgi:hypothetical protein